MALRLELAKSGRSTCKICRSPIACSAPRVGLERDDEVFVASHKKSAVLPSQWPASLGGSIVRMLVEQSKLSLARGLPLQWPANLEESLLRMLCKAL